MKAIVIHEYGSPEVLQLKELKMPTPKDDEVLIKIYASTVTAGDCELRRFNITPLFWLPLWLIFKRRKKKGIILGQEISGEIISVGKDVKKLNVGQHIFASPGIKMSGYAEYICLSESAAISILPKNTNHAEAATLIVGGLNAHYFLKKGKIKKGEKVLIIGGGGSIGTYAIQMAKNYGAHVTAIDSTLKLNMLCKIGADEVIDFTKEDFSKSGKRYDVIFDAVGKSSFWKCRNSLQKNGRYISADFSLSLLFTGKIISLFGSKKAITGLASEKPQDLLAVKKMMENGKIKAVIDKRYNLEETIAAHEYVEKGLKKGNLVIDINRKS